MLKKKIIIVLFLSLLAIVGCNQNDTASLTKPEQIKSLMIAENNLYFGRITYDDYLQVASGVLQDIEDYELFELRRSKTESLSFSDMAGMDLIEMKAYMEQYGSAFFSVEDLPDDYKSYVDISEVYDDPHGTFTFVIAFKVVELEMFDQYTVYRFSFQKVDGKDQVVMVDIDKRYGREKIGEYAMTIDEAEEMISNTVARKFYGESVNYIIHVDLNELMQ